MELNAEKILNMDEIVFPNLVFWERLKRVMHYDMNTVRQPGGRRELGR